MFLYCFNVCSFRNFLSTTMASNQEKEDEFTIRIPTKASKKYHIMKFRDNDPAQWKQVRMVRENNKKEFKNPEEEMPKFGAGSEYGREEREVSVVQNISIHGQILITTLNSKSKFPLFSGSKTKKVWICKQKV